jgi:hypothetical protein
MPLTFPGSPTPGQRYPASGEPSWTWNNTNGTWEFNRQQVDHVGKYALTNNELTNKSFDYTKLSLSHGAKTELPIAVACTGSYVDMASIYCATGKWLIIAEANVGALNNCVVQLRLYNGSTDLSNGKVGQSGASAGQHWHPASLMHVRNITSAGETIKLQAVQDSGSNGYIYSGTALTTLKIG